MSGKIARNFSNPWKIWITVGEPPILPESVGLRASFIRTPCGVGGFRRGLFFNSHARPPAGLLRRSQSSRVTPAKPKKKEESPGRAKNDFPPPFASFGLQCFRSFIVARRTWVPAGRARGGPFLQQSLSWPSSYPCDLRNLRTEFLSSPCGTLSGSSDNVIMRIFQWLEKIPRVFPMIGNFFPGGEHSVPADFCFDAHAVIR